MHRPFACRTVLVVVAALVAVMSDVVSSPADTGTASQLPPSTGVRPAPLRVISVSPRRRSTVVGDVTVTVRFSAALASRQAIAPKLVPALAGTWTQPAPNTLRFVASSAYSPGRTVLLTVPAGILAADGAVLERPVSLRYHVGQPSPARLVQLLADLRYLPTHFVSTHDPRWVNAAAQLRALYSPPDGRFVFGHGWPASLHELWARENALVIRGAVMAFESQHGLAMDGVTGAHVWSALLDAVRRGQANRDGYTYAIGSEASPETLTVFHNGSVAVRTLANTGIPAAPTAQGTFPVYERLQSQVMQGTNPDGSHYADYVQWVAYFNGGDAVHYIPRSSWGYPQSLGCIEVPYSAAERAWAYLTYGTLVTVTG